MDPAEKRNSKFGGRRARNRKIAAAPPLTENRSEDRCKQRARTPPRNGRHQKKKPQRQRKNNRKNCTSSSPKQHQLDIDPWERANYVALDCEMVGVGDEGTKSALARVCLLDWDGDAIFDTFVRVPEPVTDYRTFVSGIREEHLASDAAMDLDSCRSRVQSLVRGKILIGHALKNDLRALDILHPWHDVRDTAKYEPFMKTRFDDGVLWPRKLKELTFERLGRIIQPDGREHSPIEDAKAALDLYKSVRIKWEKVMEYKVNKTREIQMKQEAARMLTSQQPAIALPEQ